MSTSKKARILIVDDHPMLREGLAARISRQPDMEVCGEATDIDDGLVKIEAAQPDLAIIDLSLKTSHGLDLIKKVKRTSSNVKMLVCSMYDETVYAERAVRAGAMGYINKQEMPDKLLDAIRRVLSGKLYFSTELTDRLLHRATSRPANVPSNGLPSLTDRELEVFRLFGQGRSTRQIAKQLHLSLKTVETHRDNIRNKLGVETSAQLVQQAVVWLFEKG